MANQRDINRYLEPGQTRRIYAPGDFIYCKKATRAVDVMVDQEVVEMEAGDKTVRDREPGANSAFQQFEITNTDPNQAARVVLVVGYGDYNRQIIQGTVAVEPRLVTADGTYRADTRYDLSLYVDPVPNFSEQQYSFGDVVSTPATSVNTGFAHQFRWHPLYGEWWLADADNDDSKILIYSKDWTFLRETGGWPGLGGDGSGAHGQFDFADDDGAYVFTVQAESIYHHSVSGDPGDDVGPAHLTVSGSNPIVNVVRVGEDVYFSVDGNADNLEPGIYWVDRSALIDASAEPKLVAATDNDKRDLAASEGYIYAVADGWTLELFDRETGEKITEAGLGASATCIAYQDGFVWHFSDFETDVYKLWPSDSVTTVTLEGTATLGACRATARFMDRGATAWSTADVITKYNGDGTYRVYGEIIKAALALYLGAWDAVPDDYLDHVYAASIGDAKTVIATQTFEAAGVADDFSLTMPGRVDLTIDRGMWNQ